MSLTHDFNRVTFGLPVESFRVDAYIALEERLPVVTEFILRLLHICGRIPTSVFRDYFGFTDSEALAVVESLSRQGLLEVSDDEVQLSSFALERFEETGGEHPRFSKVELRQDTVTLDLISFTPLRAAGAQLPTDNIIKLNADDEVLGDSIERAKSAYRQRYAEIASMRQEFREKSYGVYSVEDIESKRRTYVPVPVTFGIDADGQIKRSVDETFERIAPAQLINFVNEQVTRAIPRTLALAGRELEEFIDAFELSPLRRYVTGRRFDLTGYLADVHIARNTRHPRGVDAMFGNVYLAANRERVVSRLRDRRSGRRRHGRLLTSLAWLAPDYPLWGRGDAFAEAVNSFSTELQSHNSSDDLYVFAYAEPSEEADVASTLRVHGLKELHYSRPLPPEGRLMAGRLEVLLYPTAFVVALCHVPMQGSPGLWAPIGFISSLPKHLDTAHNMIRKAMAGRRYGRRARFTQRDARPSPNSFEEACAFLNYDSSSTGVDSDVDDESDLPK